MITLIFLCFNKFIKNLKMLSNWNISLIFQCNSIQKTFSSCNVLIATNFLETNYRRKERYWCTSIADPLEGLCKATADADN